MNTSQSQNQSYTVTSQGVEPFDASEAAQLKQQRDDARCLVADYARHHGLREPNELAQFANACVSQAEHRLYESHASSDQAAGLEELAIREAASRIAHRDPAADEHSPSPRVVGARGLRTRHAGPTAGRIGGWRDA